MVGEAAVQWRYDPDHLAPSAVSDSFVFPGAYPDEHAVADRDDVQRFTGAVQSEPLDLAGPVDVFLDVASTAPTFELSACCGHLTCAA
jgi:predicted acyl esterase